MGRYIVADSRVIHGKPTFRGTRILVADVLEQVAGGMSWEAIIEDWDGTEGQGHQGSDSRGSPIGERCAIETRRRVPAGGNSRVNVLNENISASQRELLLRRRVRIRQIGFDIGRSGMQDADIVPFLLRPRRPTFFTRDDDFYDRQLCHVKYCLVHLSVPRQEAALFVRRFLRTSLSTRKPRMGTVVRVSHAGLSVWRVHAEKVRRLTW